MLPAVQSRIRTSVVGCGYATAHGTEFLGSVDQPWEDLVEDWNHLEMDLHMSDGGRYRLRRFGRFLYAPRTEALQRLPHAAVFQSRYINKFAGGIHRTFAALRPSTFENEWLRSLIKFDFDCFQVATPSMLDDHWEVRIHQIRIEVRHDLEIPPTPEGVHHDGHDFIAMHLIGRRNVTGGASLLYDNAERLLQAWTLEQPLDSLYVDDRRVMHAVEHRRWKERGEPGHRDMLIIDFDHNPALAVAAATES
jgi:hypothetical protein